jgi:hypothetical protein
MVIRIAIDCLCAGGNMFSGVSPDMIIIGVIVVSAVVFIVWVNRR